jgi:elongation factor Ts
MLRPMRKEDSMAEIKAAMVKQLREMTGAGMMECKKALVKAEGDMDKAVDVLRTAGLAAAAKKAGRATNEGTALAKISADGKTGAVVELNCETDFVGMNEKFKGYAEKIADAVIANKPADLDALKASEVEGETVDAILTDAIHTLGENINLKRFGLLEGDALAAYIHMGGKIGVLVAFELGDASVADSDEFKTYGRDVAMQVAAAGPIAATREDVPQQVVDHEMGIYKAQAAESGKPENIQEKIATGRMNKFYKEFVLTEQEFVKDPDKTIQQYTDEVAKKLGTTIKIKGFQRFVLGEEE